MIMMIMEQMTIDSYRLINLHFNKLSYLTTTITSIVNANHVQYKNFNPTTATCVITTISRKMNLLKSSILDDIEDEEDLVSFRSIASSYLKSKFLDCFGNEFLCYNVLNMMIMIMMKIMNILIVIIITIITDVF